MESIEKFERIRIKDNFQRSLTDTNKKSDNTNRIQISNPNDSLDYDYEINQGNQRSYTMNNFDSINGEESNLNTNWGNISKNNYDKNDNILYRVENVNIINKAKYTRNRSNAKTKNLLFKNEFKI